jgi:ATP-dependent Lon protease
MPSTTPSTTPSLGIAAEHAQRAGLATTGANTERTVGLAALLTLTGTVLAIGGTWRRPTRARSAPGRQRHRH